MHTAVLVTRYVEFIYNVVRSNSACLAIIIQGEDVPGVRVAEGQHSYPHARIC